MAVYGDQLSAFPELFEKFNNYSIEPNTVAGKKPRNLLSTFKGILQFVKMGGYGAEGDTLNAYDIPTLWSRKRLKVGTFVTHSDATVQDPLYVIKGSDDYRKQGAFYVYDLSEVVASTDKQTQNKSFNFGASNYL
jgi:hypothetical protein